MKCLYCNGTGDITKNNEKFRQTNRIKLLCPHCRGTGIEPLTNEEWLCGLSTEEKAKWFASFDDEFYPCGIYLKCNTTCDFYSQCRSDEVRPKNKEAWVAWLKQPHQ